MNNVNKKSNDKENGKVISEKGGERRKMRMGRKLFFRDLYKLRYALLGIGIYWLLTKIVFHEFCPMVILCGLPCPGCGMTRAGIFLITGQWKRLLEYNVMILPWSIFILSFLWQRYVRGKRIPGQNILIVFLFLLTIGYYLYRMRVVFPMREPMVFHENNLMEMLFPGYGTSIIW